MLSWTSLKHSTLNQQPLNAKLGIYDQNPLDFAEYLTELYKRIRIRNAFSDWESANVGVPQGSILGLLLFNIFMNDIVFDSTLSLYSWHVPSSIIALIKMTKQLGTKLNLPKTHCTTYKTFFCDVWMGITWLASARRNFTW